MDGRTQDYSPSDSGSGTHYHPHQPPNIKYEGLRSPVINNLRTSIPPTPNSEYSSAQSSARPTSFPDYTTSQQQHRAYTEAGPLRYQPPTPQEIAHHTPQTHASMSHPNAPGGSPSAYPGAQQYSYQPQNPHDMSQYGSQGAALGYGAGRPDWAQNGQYSTQAMYGMTHQTPTSATQSMSQETTPQSAGHNGLSTVYSFVPIPGAQQHKRPRRRFEEIERMYKCGWNGCEKAYGTLNHLNAHVTMQTHGSKRTPEEFKEIRREWKVKKKEDDAARKRDEDIVRQESSRQDPNQPSAQYAQNAHTLMPAQTSSSAPQLQLPPMNYNAGPAFSADPNQQAQFYSNGYPYQQQQQQQQSNQIYQQRSAI